MSGKLSKKFGQLKQWTSERLGTAEKTNAPEEFRRLDMEAESRKKGIEILTLSVADYTKTLDKRSTHERQLATLGMLAKTMRGQGAFYGDNNTYGLALQKIGEVQSRLDKIQAEFALSLRNGFLLELNSLAVSMKEYSSLKKKLENRRLDYDAKQNKLNKSKKEKPALEAEVNAAQTKYNETLSDLQILMSSFAEKEELLLEPLIDFARLQHTYFKAGYEEMSELQEFLSCQSIQDQITSNISNNEKLAARQSYNISASNDELEICSSFSRSSSIIEKLDGKSHADPLSIQINENNIHSISNNSEHKKPMSFTPKVISAPIEPVTITPKLAIVPTQKKEFVDRDEEVEYAEALYSFEAGGEGELTIQKGDTIRVFKKIDDGWWIGECQGKGSGMFPSNYVKLINKDSSNLKKSTPSIISNSHNESFSFSKKIESNKSTSSLIDSKKTVDNCNECGCEEFTANVFKQGFCNNCFHRH